MPQTEKGRVELVKSFVWARHQYQLRYLFYIYQVSRWQWVILHWTTRTQLNHGCEMLFFFFFFSATALHCIKTVAQHYTNSCQISLCLMSQMHFAAIVGWHLFLLQNFDQWRRRVPYTSFQTVHRQKPDQGRLIFSHIAWGAQWTGIRLN